MQYLVKFHQFILKLLSGNEILTSIKGHNAVRNLRNMTCNNPNLDLVNINAYPNAGQIPLIHSEVIARKRNSDRNHGSSRAISLFLFHEN